MVVHYAERMGNKKAAEVLKELNTMGADFDRPCSDQYGRTPVFEAIRDNNEELFEVIAP